MKKQKHNNHFRTVAILMTAIAVVVIGGIYYMSSIKVSSPQEVRIYIPTNSSFGALTDTLQAHHIVIRPKLFKLMARARGLDPHVKPGSYLVKPKVSYIRLIQKLYIGNQDPVLITINRNRTLSQLAENVSKKMEFSADSLLAILNNTDFCKVYGYTPQTIIGAFSQNTYQVYWNTSPKRFVERMITETDAFWQSSERDKALQSLNLNRNQVITIASIVEEETNKVSEKADIASVYLNRLRKGMKLEADPTVKYAVGDPSIRRILHKHLLVESPYNTYLNKGLPPGPICIPSPESIDAVLADKKTNYIYFCAKEDFSGYHNFASTLSQHSANAHRFHQALNHRNIMK